ncbi:MAG: hypothetical protein ABJZ55_05610 [Fuerstiella sp.]
MNKFTLALAITILTSANSMAQDFSTVRSGLLLGVYANASYDGMRVTGTIPGYSAVGRLFPGDVLVRATTDGVVVHELRSHYAMENAKSAIGPHRPAAIEIYRPGQGYLYAWVEFSPLSAPTVTYSRQSGQRSAPAASGNKAIFKMESEKQGARQLFQRTPRKPAQLNTRPRTTQPRKLPGNPAPGQRDAAKLFGR